MNFHIIDIQNSERKEYFEHYFTNVPCTFSITTDIDITNLINQKLKLYPTMIYLLTSIVNRTVEFRMSIDDNGNVGYFDEMNPSYTIFHKDSSTFSSLWTHYDNDYKLFLDNYLVDIKSFGNTKKIFPKPNEPSNTFPISMIPWTQFTSFNLNLEKGYKYLLPIFTMGKFYKKENKTFLPTTIQVHHAVCDGYHVSKFIDDLQLEINNFTL